jgi:CheY-like chemotaxis protein
VIDLSLPRLGRENTLRVLRANVRTRSIPVIALDWDSEPAMRGFDRVLVRPCSAQRLMDVIGELLSTDRAIQP